ncbi:flavin reductase family protein [Clostridium paraputrificum]|uniref:flavin reductase family protein n=1 Tax=Clostridium TaxID=1485 RepID=UPI003D350039
MSKIDFKGSVVLNPVPAVLITTKNKEGKENVFTVAWTGTVCTKPPMLSISVRPERLSYEYIKESMSFVVNLPHSGMVKALDYCGVRTGRRNDKIKEMNFTMKACEQIDASYIDECPVAIECKVNQIISLGTHDLIIADVLCSHIDEKLLDEKGKLHFENANLINYCHGEYYPMTNKSIGSFGYSVRKNVVTDNKAAEKKTSENKPSKKKITSKKLKSKSKSTTKGSKKSNKKTFKK